MIQPLRRIHRIAFLCLGIILPLLFVSGLMARHKLQLTPPTRQSLSTGTLIEKLSVNFDGRRSVLELYSAASDPAKVQIISEEPLVAPDVLVYWSEMNGSVALPSDAQLLGVFKPEQHYEIPLLQNSHGELILFSAARQQVIGTFPFEGGK